MNAFISSTSIDLLEYRLAAINALSRVNINGRNMEVFGAKPDEPKVACFDEIDSCEYFIGIYAHRYGFIPPNCEKSITQQEFEYAVQKRMPLFCFLIDEDYPWPPKYVEQPLGLNKLTDFKVHLRNILTLETFTTPKDLALKVSTSISNYISTTHSKKIASLLNGEMNLVGLTVNTLGEGKSISDVPLDAREKILTLVTELINLSSQPISSKDEQKTITPEAALALAKSYTAEKKWLEAADMFTEYAKYMPDDFQANYLRGITYANSRIGYETNIAAIRALNEALLTSTGPIHPNKFSSLYTYRGAMFKRNGRLEEAESDLLFALRFSQREVQKNDTYYNLAGVYALMGNREKLIETVIKIKDCKGLLASIRRHLNDYFKAYKKDKEFRQLIKK